MAGYQSITLAQLRTRLQELWEGVPFWTAAEANRAINEALREWNFLTGRWVGTVVVPCTALNYDYAIPNAILYRTRVSWNSRPMSVSSRQDLNYGRPHWREESTVSGGDVPARPMLWVPVSLRLIYIWPMDAGGHNALTVEGVATTPVLTADGDYVDLAEADISVLLGYALHVAAFKKGGGWFTQSVGYFRTFLMAAGQENSLITTSQVYRRFMGLDHRDQKPTIGAPASLDRIVETTIEAAGGGS